MPANQRQRLDTTVMVQRSQGTLYRPVVQQEFIRPAVKKIQAASTLSG